MPTPQELNIPDKLDSILATKQAIRESIVAKGVEVPEGTTFRQYADLISGISTGLTDEALALANATPEDVIAGKTFYAGNRELKTGTASKGFALTQKFTGVIKKGEPKTFATNSKNVILFGGYDIGAAFYSMFVYIENARITQRFYAASQISFSFIAAGNGLQITLSPSGSVMRLDFYDSPLANGPSPLYIFEG